MQVENATPPTAAAPDVELCEGYSQGDLEAAAIAAGGGCSDCGSGGCTDETITDNDDGSYTVSCTNEGGTATATGTVTVHEDPTVSANAPAEVGEGATGFEVTIDIDDVTDLAAAQFDVTYDPDVVRVTGTEGGTEGVTAGEVGGNTIDVDMWGFVPEGAEGTVRVIVNVPGEAASVSGSGYLAKVHFDVVGSSGDTSNIDPSNGLSGDSDAQEIPATWVEDTVTVTSSLGAGFSADPTEGYADETSFAF
ncbi:MAG: cohesin domain-containing protein, partial [Anaerolineae bacterium]